MDAFARSAIRQPSSPMRLPPGVLQQVVANLNHLPQDLHSFDSSSIDALLDMMAFSMVCRDWYAVSRPFIPDAWLAKPLDYMPIVRYGSQVRRLASLLSTSQQLGLAYCGEIELIDISVADFIEDENDITAKKATDPEDQEALFTILRLATQTGLSLNIPVITPNSNQQRGAFLSALAQHCATIHELKLYFPYKWTIPIHDDLAELLQIVRPSSTPPETHIIERPMPPADPHLASLVHAMSPSLTSVSIQHEADATTLGVLSRCACVRIASFDSCGVRLADDLLRELKGLSEVRLRSLFGDGTGRLLAGLESARECLEVLVLEESRVNSEREASACAVELELLVKKCERLRYLRASEVMYMSDGVLRAAAHWCRGLERLEMSSTCCVLVTGMGIWNDVMQPWPGLRKMDVTSRRVVPQFVERILLKCAGLEEAVLSPMLSEDANVRAALERGGFETDDKRSSRLSLCWHRLVTGGQAEGSIVIPTLPTL